MSILGPVLQQLTSPGQLLEVVPDQIGDRAVRTYLNRPRNLRDLVPIGIGHGDREYLVQGEQRVTFAAAFDRSLRLAAALHAHLGVQPGDRVGILGANAPDWVVAHWAVVAVQGIVVPFNAWWAIPELAFGLDDSGTSFLFADQRRAEVALAAGFPAERLAVWGPGPVPDGAHTVDRLAAEGPLPLDQVPAAHEDSVAALFYTSGTTGRPKASANTHRNIVANLMNAAAFHTASRIVSGTSPPAGLQESNLCVVPLFHATANLTQMVPFVFTGNRIVFLPPGRFDPEQAAATIERERITSFGGVPTVVARMLEAGVHQRYDLSSVDGIGYGGAPASPALVERISQAFPNVRARLANGYGLTETSALSTVNTGPDYLERPSSVGLPAPVVDLRVVGPDGDDLAPGERGEVWIGGSNVISGYWGRPEDNARSFVDGYLRSGDIGYLDDDGFLYITDRGKDMIVRGGENVYGVEVEAALEAHEAVLEAAVLGSPHPLWGEEVMAVVVLAAEGDATEQELARFLSGRIAGFKIPTRWELRTEPLPRNPSGKVMKSQLRGGEGVFAVGGDAVF